MQRQRLIPPLLALAMLLSPAHQPLLAATVGSIHGVVRDAADGKPLADAQIAVHSRSSRYETTSDAHGFYSIVGIRPDTYTVDVMKSGYQALSGITVSIVQDSAIALDLTLTPQALKTIATVTARSATFPVQPNQPDDVYVTGVIEQAQLGGIPGYENEGLLLNALPGVSAVGGAGGGYTGSGTSVRGGLANDTGYQLDGINATDPITNFFINNLVLNGAQNVLMTAGPGDASKGGSGSGYVNIVSKIGTYPSTGFLQLDDGGPAFEHNAKFEFGTATQDRRYSLFLSGRYSRDFGGCCAPPYGNTYGGSNTSFPDTLGQTQFESTNDTLANFLWHFGRDQANTLQIWGELGANQQTGGYGINPATYPFASANPAYLNVYAQAPLFLNPAATPLTPGQAQALIPFFPTQSSAQAAIGALPAENTEYDLFKIAYSRAIGARAFVNARLYRTQNRVVDSFADPNDPVFGYGLPSFGFSDTYVVRSSQNTGIAADLQQQIGEHHASSYGFEYRFSRASLDGFLPSSSLFFAGPTIADFLPVNPLTGAPGIFAGSRYPTFNETIRDPMHRTSFYLSDDWSPNGRLLVQPGLRYDLQTVPTAAGRYEANQFQPRLFGTLTLGTRHETVVRGGYGHATTFAPLFQIESIYNPPASYHNVPATLPICGGTAANFSAPCADYFDQLYNAWWKGYGVNPYAFSRAQQSDSYDLSIERAFSGGIGMKLTVFDRRDYDVIVNSQQVTVSQGAVIPGTVNVTNDGRAQTLGAELQISRQITQGLSVQLNATYVNQFVNYLTPMTPAFRPAVQPALLASGTLFHPQYLSPFTATASFDYRTRDGWRIDPILQYIRGFPVGAWANDAAFINGTASLIPNTNLFGNFNGQPCSYVDPQTPGTPQSPNVVGSTGGGCNAALNVSLTHPVLYANLAISRDLSRRITLGLEIQNLFNNYANYPYYNPGYINNGFGVSGPGSGTNPVAGFPGTIPAYAGGPFIAYPSGHGRQFSIFTRFSL